MSRCDLHIHSKFSARSEDWLFRRFDFPDSCTEPLELYAQLRERGMDFVTITDHDCIDGCLAIADKPQTFISEQVTTYFPQDPCKVHVLVWGITPGAASRYFRLPQQHFRAAKVSGRKSNCARHRPPALQRQRQAHRLASASG